MAPRKFLSQPAVVGHTVSLDDQGDGLSSAFMKQCRHRIGKVDNDEDFVKSRRPVSCVTRKVDARFRSPTVIGIPGGSALDATAVTFDSHTRSFNRIEIKAPTLLAGQVLVRVQCCTICGSDLHTYLGRRTAPASCVLGHEIVGVLEDWNSNQPPKDFQGSELRRGQRITWTMAVGCGDCFFCQRGLPQKCQTLFKYGHEPIGDGYPTGGLASHCVLQPQTPLFAVPNNLTDEVAAIANCATATVSAALRLVQQVTSLHEATVVVLGAGMLGLTACAQLAQAGARHVILADKLPERCKLGSSFGATRVVSAGKESVVSCVADVSDGRGADVSLDFAGQLPAVIDCLASLRVGGVGLLAGTVFPTEELGLKPEQLVRRMLTIRGLHNYTPLDLQHALRFLSDNVDRFPFANLVERTFSLDQTAEAFSYATSHHPVRVAVRP